MIEDIKKTLWATADKLRANMDAAEYKHLVLGLIFVKYISDTFSARRAELTRRFSDQSDDYYLDDPELLAGELEDRDYYKEVNVFWVPESARWEALRAAAKQPEINSPRIHTDAGHARPELLASTPQTALHLFP